MGGRSGCGSERLQGGSAPGGRELGSRAMSPQSSQSFSGRARSFASCQTSTRTQRW
jgi:hypothetical protein